MKTLPVFCLLTALIALMLMPAGCSTTPVPEKTLDPSETSSSRVERLAGQIAEAKKEQVNLLSPTWFAKAQASYEKAKSALDKGGHPSKVLNAAAQATAELSQARKFADSSRYHLGDVIKSRQMAIKARADRYAKDFYGLEEDFKDLTEAVEENNIKTVRKKKAALDAAYRDLELKAIDADALGNIRQLVQMLVDQGADEIAPRSYSLAKEKLAEAKNHIVKNRYDKQGIEQRAETARFYVERLQQIAASGRKLEKMEPEAIALWMESFLEKTGGRLKEPDRRNLPFDVQQAHIINAIDVLQHSYELSLNHVKKRDEHISLLEQRLAETEGQSYKVKADKERLAAEKRFNALFTQVQRLFNSDEAEVYKRADEMIIRLKAMRFPVGQAVIIPENYPLLTKVQKAIKTFGEPDVVIEGHTDSTGSQAKNEKLSMDRARAVRQYLIANGTLPKTRIQAKGYGSSRPLASNKTKQGRAMNRRIDLVIKPEMKAN